MALVTRRAHSLTRCVTYPALVLLSARRHASEAISKEIPRATGIKKRCRRCLNVIRSHGCATERWFTLGIPPALLGDYDGPGAHGGRHVHFGEIKLRIAWYNKAQHEWDCAHPKTPPASLPEVSEDSFMDSSSDEGDWDDDDDDDEQDARGMDDEHGDDDDEE